MLLQIQLILKLLLETHDHVDTVAVHLFENEEVVAAVRLSNCDGTSQMTVVVQVRLIDEIFDFFTLHLRVKTTSWAVSFSENADWLSRRSIGLKEEELKLLLRAILEATDQVEVLFSVVLLQHGRKFDMEVRGVVSSVKLHYLCDKLLGELRNVSGEPSVQGESLDIITGAKYDNELVWLNRTVREADGYENFAGLLLNDRHESLDVFHELAKAGHRHIQNKDLVVGG